MQATARVMGAPLLAMSLVVLAACGGGSDDAAADPTAEVTGDAPSAGVDLPGGTIAIEGGDEGASAQIGTELPEDFPAEVYLPEDLVTTNATRQERDDQVTFTLIGLSTTGPDEVIAEVQAGMGDESDRTDAGGSTTLVYEGIGEDTVRYTIQANADGDAMVTIGTFPTA